MTTENPTESTSSATAPGMSLIGLLLELYRGKWIILSITAVFLVLGVIYIIKATPYYRAQVVVVPTADEANSGGFGSLLTQFGGAAGVASGLGGDSGIGLKAEALAVLESRAFITAFLKSRNLLPVLFSDSWDAQQGAWIKEARENPPTYSKGQRYFIREILSISEDRDSGVVRISIDWHNREQARNWANSLVEDLNSKLRESSLQESRNKIDYLNQELSKVSVSGIQQGIYNLLEAELSNIAFANTRKEFAFRVIDPAVLPDSDDPVKPRKALALVGALFLAFLISFVIILIRSAIRQSHQT